MARSSPCAALVAAIALGVCAVTGCASSPARKRVTQLTKSGARNGQAFFSPDGTQIAFVSDRENGWQVWRAAADGSTPDRLTAEAAPVGWPSWSADGLALYFYGQRDGRYQLLRVGLTDNTVSTLDAGFAEGFRPLLSPAGDRLLFDAVDPTTRTGHDIFIRLLRDNSVQRLTDDPGYDSDARWSPDGTRIVFHSDRNAPTYQTQVYVMTDDGRNVRPLTSGPAVNGYPSWSPNGRCVVYTSEASDNRDLWVVGLDGATRQRLTWHAGFDGDPVWDPAGGRILFSTDRFGGVELAYLEIAPDLVARCEDEPPTPAMPQ